MNGPRTFFSLCLIIGGVLGFLIINDTLPEREIPAEVVAGHEIWRRYNCAGCHTLHGQGGAYGPDLTTNYTQRGETYLREFFVNPNAFHPNARPMPRFALTVAETDALIAFLADAAMSEHALAWPPRMIAVSGLSGVGMESFVEIEDDRGTPEPAAILRGRETFTRQCASCHSLMPDSGGLPGPSLFGIADRAWYRVIGQSAEQYIRISILDPSDYIVEGYADVMPKNFGEILSSDEINDLVIFMLMLEDPNAGDYDFGGARGSE